jgi:hypothetical protein
LFLKHAVVIQATSEHAVHTSLTGTIRDQLGEFGIGSKTEVATLRRDFCFPPDCVEKLENCGAPKISQT